MERRYSETARKRRRLCKGVVLVIMLLLFGRFLTGAMGNFMEGALKFGLEKACPLVFSYRESVKEDGQVSLWDKVFVPSVLAYMWEEDALMEEEDEQQDVLSALMPLLGKKQDEEPAEYLIKERSYSKFSRSFTVPEDVENDKISAKVENGVLKVVMPRKALEQPRRIAITAA